MNKKYIFCDIDGTIVEGKYGIVKPSEKTIYAFNELKKNHYVLLSSGRMKCFLDDYIMNLNPNGFILGNGAYGEFNNEIIVEDFISEDNVFEIIKLCKELDGIYLNEDLDFVYTNDKNHRCYKAFLESWKPLSLADVRIGEELKHIYISMYAFENVETTNRFIELISDKLHVIPHRHLTSGDVNTIGVSKGSGITKLIERLGINKEDCIAFGDGDNDLEMIEAVGRGYAMIDGSELLKSKTKYHAPSVKDDGLYYTLVELGLISPLKE